MSELSQDLDETDTRIEEIQTKIVQLKKDTRQSLSDLAEATEGL